MANVSTPSCPQSFVYYPQAIHNPNVHCDLNGCCLSCPHFNNFYGEGKIELLFTVLACIGIIGFFLMIFLALTFIVLPSTKHNPVIRKILLPLALSVLLFSAADFFSIDQQRTQCVDDVSPATIHNNNLCGAQAFFELAGAYAVALWASVLIINLHMLSVWRSDFVLRNIKYFHIPIWIIVFLAAFLPMILNQVESGGFCFVSHKATPIFFYILSFIFPVCLLHLVTLAYMAKVSSRANSRQKEGRMSFSETQVLFVHIKHVIKVQWRAFVGAAFMLVVYVTDVFYFIISTRKFVITPDTAWFAEWIECLGETGDQDYCSSYAKVPSFALQVFVFTLNRSVGVVIFIIFAAKKSVFKELVHVLTRSPGEESMLGISSFSDSRGIGSRMSSIAKRGRLDDYSRGRSKGAKTSPEVRKVEYNPRNLDNRKDEQSRNKRTNRKLGNNRSKRETREAKTRATNVEPVTELVVNMAVLPPSSIPASPRISVPTYIPSNHLLSPPKLHFPPPPPFDPPTSLSPRPRKIQYIGDSNTTAFQSSIMQETDVTSTEVQSADAQISSPAQNDTDLNDEELSTMQVSDFTSTEVQYADTLVSLPAPDFYGESSNASQPSLSQLSDVPSIDVQYIDVQVSLPAQNDNGTSSNSSQSSLSQLSDVPSTEVQSTQVSSSTQNDYDTSSNTSQPIIQVSSTEAQNDYDAGLNDSQPIMQVSDVTSPEVQYTDMLTQNGYGHASYFSISQLTDVPLGEDQYTHIRSSSSVESAEEDP